MLLAPVSEDEDILDLPNRIPILSEDISQHVELGMILTLLLLHHRLSNGDLVILNDTITFRVIHHLVVGVILGIVPIRRPMHINLNPFPANKHRHNNSHPSFNLIPITSMLLKDGVNDVPKHLPNLSEWINSYLMRVTIEENPLTC